ncbi:MAG: hypothetical protein Q4D04_09730 [Clostridia bacterium]|nr:hypothetical protein [Clostridia bacterium]
MKYIRRLLWFLASRVLVLTVVVSVLVLSFYLAMNAANIYILLSDGMQARTNTILTREDADMLPGFFRDELLNNDEALALGLSDSSPYINYNITSFESNVSLEWIWSWPWEDVAQATISHTVENIEGSVRSGRSSLVASGELSADPPEWHGGRFNVVLERVAGQWKIASMVQTQVFVN